MNNNLKQIRTLIDDIIEKADSGELTLSDEQIDLLNEVINYANVAKLKDKTAPIQELLDKISTLLEAIKTSQEAQKTQMEAFVEAVKGIDLDLPTPQVDVKPPEVKVNVPMGEVIDSLNALKRVVSEIYIPEEVSVKEPSWIEKLILTKPLTDVLSTLDEIKKTITSFKMPTLQNPMPVSLVFEGKFYRALGSGLASAVGSFHAFRDKENKGDAGLVDGDGVVQTNLRERAMKITVAGSITYVGLAAPGTAQASALWQCRKIDETSGTVVTWADGNSNFDNTATDLTALTYS